MGNTSANQVIVIGGGAAGFFFAINIARMRPDLSVHILEKSQQLLSKVKISGGGRCNVTHACFDPDELITYYPRGGKELRGPFHNFQPADTIAWFEERGVNLHTENDGRMFPETNLSQTIIDCFLNEAKKYHVHIHTNAHVRSIEKMDDTFEISTQHSIFQARYCMITSGSSENTWRILQSLGHSIEPPVPSLFTFHIQDPRLQGLMGVSIPNVQVQIIDSNIQTEGPLLITHWGLSGPAILKASAWGARFLGERKYLARVLINFLPQYPLAECVQALQTTKSTQPKKQIYNSTIHPLSARLWKQLCAFAKIPESLNWADASNTQLQTLAQVLTASVFTVKGKSTFKEEFVTCGGVRLTEIDMRTMESKLHPGLYFAGEVMDVDAVTGGFNFQAAWTTAFLAALAIAVKPSAL